MVFLLFFWHKSLLLPHINSGNILKKKYTETIANAFNDNIYSMILVALLIKMNLLLIKYYNTTCNPSNELLCSVHFC